MAHPTTTLRRGRAFRRGGLLVAAALSVAAFAAPGAADAASCPGADTPISHSDEATLTEARDALICLANDARANAGLSQLTETQRLDDVARHKSDDYAKGGNIDYCGGMTHVGFAFSRCYEARVSWKPGPTATAQQLFDWLVGQAGLEGALLDGGVTEIGAGVSNGNHDDGPSADGAVGDIVMITPDDAGTGGNQPNNGGNNGANQNPPDNGACAGAGTPITQNNIDAAEDAIACLVNLERKKVGLAPLTVNAALHGAARAHSQDMVARKFFSHVNPDQAAWCDRISAAGYQAKCVDFGGQRLCEYCRENIAYRGGGATPNDFMYDPQYGWMTHPEPNQHRETILDPKLKAIGVGVVIGSKDGADGATATQDFGG